METRFTAYFARRLQRVCANRTHQAFKIDCTLNLIELSPGQHKSPTDIHTVGFVGISRQFQELLQIVYMTTPQRNIALLFDLEAFPVPI